MKNTQRWIEEYTSSLQKKNIAKMLILGFQFPVVIIKDLFALVGLK
jgi:hypothetical protein